MMGYVLPVQMDAYTQYANRINSTNKPIKMDPVVRPAFYRVDPQYSWEDIQKNTRSSMYRGKKEERASSHISDHLLAELTGKGRYVNESI
ncbi:hypothetical protein LC085_09000 [Bacillus tianshenii]|uniref:hypothetical protein n=1 Tax=Sutcliffiella tianshenii TaxID=1463404 RepID=UPI001CD7DB56|nr:hypothetical protein [Bacillus tianshenii]MCA1320038.1 hypothetical protein [Bacillus tianshenii]